MKKLLFVLAAVPCFCFSFQQSKEPSLRIETLNPDGTKTVREMVSGTQLKKERIETKKIAQPNPQPKRVLSSQIITEKQRYLALIVAKLQQNWFVDDTMRGKECRINIKLAPDGKVISTTPLGGDYNLCMSAVAAVEKAGNFPMSEDPDVYDALKDITPTLRPELR